MLFYSILVQKAVNNDNSETSIKCVDDSDNEFNAPVLIIITADQPGI